MNTRIFPASMILSCFVCLFCSQTVFAKNIFHYKDVNGKDKYSQTVPPEAAKLERDKLSPSGRRIDHVDREKSKEEREQQKRFDDLRREQNRIIARQKTYDNALLNTYHSKSDLIMAIKSKWEAFETQNEVVEGNLNRLKQDLESQQKHAAEMDRNGQKVTAKQMDSIKSTQNQIQDMQIAINQQKEKQNQTRTEDEADIARFLFLTQSVTEGGQKRSIPSIKEASELGLFYCENDHQCNKAWEIARTFVDLYSTTERDVFNDKLIMNRPPATDTDISLSLSKIPLTDEESQLFLDVHCRESSIGKDLCKSQKINDIRASFIPYVNKVLSGTAQ